MKHGKIIVWMVFLFCMSVLQFTLVVTKILGDLDWIWFWVLMPVWISGIIRIVDYLFTKIERNFVEFEENENIEHSEYRKKVQRLYELTGVRPRIIFEGGDVSLNLDDFDKKLAKKDFRYNNIECKYKGRAGYNLTSYVKEVYGKEVSQLIDDLI